MKKIIAWLLVLTMCVAMFAGCQGDDPADTGASTDTKDTENNVNETSALDSAVAYVKTVYKDAAETTGSDYQVIGTVPVKGEKFTVTWTADVAEDLVKIVVGEDGMVTIDVNETTPEEVKYVLTASLTDGKETKTLSWNHVIPAYVDISKLTDAEIVDIAYAIESGVTTEDSYTLTGVISKIDTAWSEDYQNITVTIKVEGKEDKPIQCYRLKGEGAKDLAIGDTITVEGFLKNYNGTIEFDSGCALTKVVKSEGEAPVAPEDPKEIVDAAYALETDSQLPYIAVLTGTITEIGTPYSEDYKNITVTITVEGKEDKPIICFRLKGDGADKLAVGDVITVTGSLMNYAGTVEFNSGCTFVMATTDTAALSFGSMTTATMAAGESDYASIVDAAYALASGESISDPKTLKGKITSIDTPYSTTFFNITVTIAVEGKEDKPIKCYRLKGEGADALAVGDTITVSGTLKNYNGTIEFDANCTLDAVVKGGGVAPTAPEDPKEIVDALYALSDGESLPYEATLTGKITKINTPYDSGYKNVTVTIVVEGKEDKPIVCYRMKGTGADVIAVGDTITVTGSLKNFGGTFEFASPSLTSYKKPAAEPETPVTAPSDPKQIVDEAHALETGKSLKYTATLTGVITSVDTPYSSQYGNITVTITVAGKEDKPIQCYRIKGTGADTLAVGDTITVTGTITNYEGKIQFASGSSLDAVVKGENEAPVAPEDPKEIVDAAYALDKDTVLPYEATLTGKITKVDTAYDDSYKNVTVTIVVEGKEDKPIVCFRLKGTGADKIKVGDTITVKGNLENHAGTVEFGSGCVLVSAPQTGIATALLSVVAVISGAAVVLLKKKAR